MAVLHAEIQVAGIQSDCTKISYSFQQGVDYAGRPNTGVLAKLIKFTFTGKEALEDKWIQLALDSYRRESGHIAFFNEEGRTLRRLTFYDAYCVHYELRFDARGQDGQASLETEIHFSAAAVDIDGAHVENHTKLWWEKSPVVRFNALLKPAQLVAPSPSLRASPTAPSVPSPSTPNKPSKASKNKRKRLLGAKPTKEKSKRLQYLGRTPGKGSTTGQAVQKRMAADGKIRGNQNNKDQEILGPDGNWHPIENTDMGHLYDAVSWWNTTGRHHGPKSPEVRRWMLDSDNYELEPSSINRSRGAKLKETYLPPLK